MKIIWFWELARLKSVSNYHSLQYTSSHTGWIPLHAVLKAKMCPTAEQLSVASDASVFLRIDDLTNKK